LHALGLVNRVVKREDLLGTARELASRIAGRSSFSVSRLKRLLTQELSGDLGRSLELEQQATIAAFATPDAARRVQTFLKRK